MTASRSIGITLLLAIALAGAIGILTAATWMGSRLVYKYTLDAKGEYIAARFITREAAPGDDVAIALYPGGTLQTVRARIDGGPENTWTADRRGGDHIVIELPPDMKPGLATIKLEVEVGTRIETGRMLNTVYYRDATRTRKIELALEVRSPAERTWRRWLFRGLALVSWLAGFALSYVVGRWAFRRLMAKWDRKNKEISGETALLLFLVVGVAVAIAGQLVFVGPILRTTTIASWLPTLVVQFGWTCAITLGLWRGLVARSKAPPPHLWDPVRLRAVIGSGREVGYREAQSTLPPMLSRDAPRRSSAEIIETLRELGCEVVQGRGVLEVTVDAEPVMQLRPRSAEPWLPEELAVSVRDGIDATPLVLQLTKLFGPLEVKPPRGKAVILEHRA